MLRLYLIAVDTRRPVAPQIHSDEAGGGAVEVVEFDRALMWTGDQLRDVLLNLQAVAAPDRRASQMVRPTSEREADPDGGFLQPHDYTPPDWT